MGKSNLGKELEQGGQLGGIVFCDREHIEAALDATAGIIGGPVTMFNGLTGELEGFSDGRRSSTGGRTFGLGAQARANWDRIDWGHSGDETKM